MGEEVRKEESVKRRGGVEKGREKGGKKKGGRYEVREEREKKQKGRGAGADTHFDLAGKRKKI